MCVHIERTPYTKRETHGHGQGRFPFLHRSTTTIHKKKRIRVVHRWYPSLENKEVCVGLIKLTCRPTERDSAHVRHEICNVLKMVLPAEIETVILCYHDLPPFGEKISRDREICSMKIFLYTENGEAGKA